ncbi:AAA family ATPase [uncultured Tenacibaculum sp.]|uniref:AAA family ATPase n=1 Tax=uncultured Tenacibaculum sp. TaxID=174713 RepID=UPI002629FD77|nr:AAA family ATPase [uncultured Tenacibaculum sp.]
MKEDFITGVKIKKSRNVKDLNIKLSKNKRQHIIITGKNGSGKTSLLLEIFKFLKNFESGHIREFNSLKYSLESKRSYLESEKDNGIIFHLESEIRSVIRDLEKFGGIELQFSSNISTVFEKYLSGKYLLTFFGSKRFSHMEVPSGIFKTNLKKQYNLNERANQSFIQYIVNLKADRSFARDDGETKVVEKIDAWFDRLEMSLKIIFDTPNLKLEFDRKNYNFNIHTEEREPFSFNTLSDGYSAILAIVSELILRMEAQNVDAYDLEGIVIIDEIETHLHVDLQKKILPFLIGFFPKLQFIVTTHSPFVLSSVSDAIICDLETRTITSDLSSYSYDALIESYFKADKYSDIIKTKIIEFKRLTSLKNRTSEENSRLHHLRNYFAHAPKYLSNELMVQLQQIKLKELNNKNS